MPHLIPIEIRGLGTPDVESLSSYIHRLACAHEVTVARLLHNVAAWYQAANSDVIREFTRPGSAGDLSVYVRPNQGTADILRILSAALNESDLTATTFISLHHALDRSAGVFNRRMKWCPLCMKESQVLGEPGYYKLIWTLKDVTHCPDHRIALQEECQACGGTQGGYGYKTDPYKCQKCGEELSVVNQTTDSFINSWKVPAPDLLDLVGYISRHPGVEFTKNAAKSALNEIFDKAWRDGEEDKLWDICPKDELLAFIEHDTPITITKLRRVAFQFSLNLVDVLRGDLYQSPAILNAKWSKVLPDDLCPKPRVKHPDKDGILKKVHNAMKCNRDSPKPLVFYANLVGVSTGYLNYHHPVLSKRIVVRHKNWKRDEKIRIKRQAYNEVLKLLASREPHLITLSKKSVLREIRRNTSLPKFVVRDAIKEIFEKMTPGL